MLIDAARPSVCAAFAAGEDVLPMTNAKNAVANTSNRWNLDTQSITSTGSTSYQVDFATSSSGPWSQNPNPASGYIYSRVQASAAVKLYFMPVVVASTTQNVNVLAVGGQIAENAISHGLGPFSAVSGNITDPNFGFVVGGQYDLQWPAYNGSRANCNSGNPQNCFVQSPCADETRAAEQAITQYWGASINGYWGSTANSTIASAVLDVIQLQPVSVGQAITMASGNKNAEAVDLDTRVNQDVDLIDNVPATYLSNTHNERRMMPVPVVNPTANGTYVVGFGAFLLISNGTPSNYYASGSGNDPFCAVYMGPYVQGGVGPGGGNAGYFVVKLVQ